MINKVSLNRPKANLVFLTNRDSFDFDAFNKNSFPVNEDSPIDFDFSSNLANVQEKHFDKIPTDDELNVIRIKNFAFFIENFV